MPAAPNSNHQPCYRRGRLSPAEDEILALTVYANHKPPMTGAFRIPGLLQDGVLALSFTSPSTVKNFFGAIVARLRPV